MTNRVRSSSLLACVLAVLVALVAVVLVREGDKGGGEGLGHPDAQSELGWFIISGDVRHLIAPGVSAAVDLGFTNRRAISLSVSDIQVEVRGVNAPHAERGHPCTAADFTVKQVPRGTEVIIPAHEKRSLSELGVPRRAWPHLGLVNRPVNQDGCKGASLVLSYSASGAIGW